eukprot:5106436-Prymnesium_polylepis.1
MLQVLRRKGAMSVLTDCYAADCHIPHPRFLAWVMCRCATHGSIVILHSELTPPRTQPAPHTAYQTHPPGGGEAPIRATRPTKDIRGPCLCVRVPLRLVPRLTRSARAWLSRVGPRSNRARAGRAQGQGLARRYAFRAGHSGGRHTAVTRTSVAPTGVWSRRFSRALSDLACKSTTV